MKEKIKSSTLGGLNKKIEEFMENYGGYEWDFTTIVIGQNFLGEHEYEWVATISPKPTADTLKELLVEEHGIVRHFWSKVDIQEWATNRYRALTDNELEKVADSLSKTDCEYGISWQTIDNTITGCVDGLIKKDDDEEPEQPEVWDEASDWERRYDIDLDTPTFDKIEDGLTPEQ